MGVYNDFDDTEMSYNTGEKILMLTDKLSEDIIYENIDEQLTNDGSSNILDKINYLTLFREKYNSISPEDDEYDDEIMKEIASNLSVRVNDRFKNKYGVYLAYEDNDNIAPLEFISDLEVLYEFLFIRHQDNVAAYISDKLKKFHDGFVEKYQAISEVDSTLSNDIFMLLDSKKFKDKGDVIIIHFLNEIINDIIDSESSIYDMFMYIVNLDLYEEFNNRMSELLIQYGNKLVVDNDEIAYRKYVKLLKNPSLFSEIRNKILLDYLKECRIND